MKIYILGSCSGTEPMPGRHHTSFVIETNNRFYWFDAGENCSYAAHLSGIDLLSVSDVFISHTHMDHVGGLANLLWNIRKISNVKNILPRYGNVTVYTPNTVSFNGTLTMLENSEGNYKNEYKTITHKINDGILLQNSDIQVCAQHNFHLPKSENGWQSFSFCIKSENKKIIYSGDVEELDDMATFLKDGCDILLMETGHHTADSICKEIINKAICVKKIYFLHHGRGILYDYEGTLSECRKIFPEVNFCNDGDVFSV